MKIGALQKVSLIEYPGKICATVFTQGCNFRCPYCHNPKLVDPHLYEKCLPEEEIFLLLEKRKGKLEAVTITGGEPTIQHDLIRFIKQIREMGFSVKVDTNGSNPEVIEELIKESHVNYIAMDIKSPLSKYSKVTGIKIDNDKIKKSIKLIMSSGIPYEFRTTVVKELVSTEDILEIGNLIKGARVYNLQHFVPAVILDKELLRSESYTPEEMADIRKRLLKNISFVQIR